MATTPVIWDSFNSYAAPSDLGAHFSVTGTTAINQVAERSRSGTGSIVLPGGASMTYDGISSPYVVVNLAAYIGIVPTSGARSVVEFRTGATLKARVLVNSDSTLRLDISTTQRAVSTASVNVGAMNYLECIYYSHATLGVFAVYLDGLEVVSFTGDTVGASGDVTSGLFRGFTTSTSTTVVGRTNISDIVISTVTGTPTAAEARLGAVVHSVIVPTSDVTVAGTPSTGTDNFAMVDETPNDGDTTYVELALVDDSDLYGHTSSLPADTEPLGVAVFSAQRLPTGGTTQVRHRINDGTTTVNGSDLGVGETYGVNASFWDESPFGTPGPWTVAAVEALRFGIEARS